MMDDLLSEMRMEKTRRLLLEKVTIKDVPADKSDDK